MGDRTSIQFVEEPRWEGDDGNRSIVVCDHWGGEEFPKIARAADAMDSVNTTGYQVADKGEIVSWLTKQKGKRVFTISW